MQPGNSTVYFYLFNTNQGFEMSLDSNGGIQSGWLEAQKQTTMAPGGFMMGQMPQWSEGDSSNVGEFSIDSSGDAPASITSAGPGNFSWDQQMGMTYSWDTTAPSTGTFLVNAGSKGVASCAVINSTKAVCTPQNDSAPTPMIMLQ
jgi:hypothetical protein